MKASVRISSLTLGGSGSKTLPAMEKHGKRLDGTSQRRRVRDRDPLVYGSLDLRQAFDQHTEGCRMNKGLKRPVMHALVQFPKEISINEKSERMMLKTAIQFINETHGGDAVFAARLDRDEEGQHTVDVFYSPKYEKVTKARGAETWISTSKHGKELCAKHREEIERRHGGRFLTGPRQVGIAMQSEFGSFLNRHGIELDAKIEKGNSVKDQVEPETYKARQEMRRQGDLLHRAGHRLLERKKKFEAKEAELERERFAVQTVRRQLLLLYSSLRKALLSNGIQTPQRERASRILAGFSLNLAEIDPETPIKAGRSTRDPESGFEAGDHGGEHGRIL